MIRMPKEEIKNQLTGRGDIAATEIDMFLDNYFWRWRAKGAEVS
jgi:hypothetical protein